MKRLAVLAVGAGFWATGCGVSTPPQSAVAVEPEVGSHLTPPPETGLLRACTPTGPELCFNARDDNCNGVIDEGCGLPTGLLQFVIAWESAAADVDLAVTTPSGERLSNERGHTASHGFHIGRDCPGEDGCSGQNVENVYFDGAEPPVGHYAVDILLADLHGAPSPVKVRFGARLGGRTVGFDVELAPGDAIAKKTFSFDIP